MSAIVRQGRHGSPPDSLPGSQPGHVDLYDGYRAGSWPRVDRSPVLREVPVSVEVHGCRSDPGSQFVDPGSAQVAVVVKPVQLFDGEDHSIDLSRGFDISADGRKLLLASRVEGADPTLVVVQNWLAGHDYAEK